MQILKFRTFSSKQSEGFIIFKRGHLPELILEDILFQLFQPLFPEIYCPEIYFFSSTDQILRVQDLNKNKDYIYVHFLQRIQSYGRNKKIKEKLIIGSIQQMSKGIKFQGTNIYIFSEKQYQMYSKQVFKNSLQKRIQQMDLKQQRKKIKYEQYINQLQQLKDNFQMMRLKDEINTTVQTFREKVNELQINYSRCLKIKVILDNILKNAGIHIQSINDLK